MTEVYIFLGVIIFLIITTYNVPDFSNNGYYFFGGQSRLVSLNRVIGIISFILIFATLSVLKAGEIGVEKYSIYKLDCDIFDARNDIEKHIANKLAENKLNVYSVGFVANAVDVKAGAVVEGIKHNILYAVMTAVLLDMFVTGFFAAKNTRLSVLFVANIPLILMGIVTLFYVQKEDLILKEKYNLWKNLIQKKED